MTDHSIGPFPIDGVRMPTWIVRFDEEGICTSTQTRAMLLTEVRKGTYTDVIVFSHGWNNEFGYAMTLYGAFLKQFEALPTPSGRPFTPLFVGFTWPSTWFVSDAGPSIAAPGDDERLRSLQSQIVVAAAAKTPNVDRMRLLALLKESRLDRTAAKELAALMAPLFAGGDDELGTTSSVDAEAVLMAVEATQRASQPSGTSSTNFDDFGTTTGAPPPVESPQSAGFLDVIDPRNFVRMFSTYQMKDRAGHVGWRGMAPLLRDLVKSPSTARVHAAGHSYGCKVMLSAICEPTPFNRALDSLLLLQPAISHLSFAAKVPGTQRAGGYRAALDATRVRPPILCTYSKHDFPLHGTFHLGMRRAADLGEAQIAAPATSAGAPPSVFAALGGYGPRDAAETLIEPIPAAPAPYPFLAEKTIVGLDGSQGQIMGHGDVTTPVTAWALHQLVFRNA